MQKYNTSSSSWYSIIAAIMMIGFLLVLTTSTLNLVLQEMQDGKGRQDYMKAYSAAEWSIELALYKIKEKWYGYDDVEEDLDTLWTDNKIAKISYDFDSQVSSYTWELAPFETDIIPLFWIDSSGGYTETYTPVLSSVDSSIVWNILWEAWGVSNTWPFNYNNSVGYKTLTNFSSIRVETFLNQAGYEYLILYNPSSTTESYTLAVDSWEYFTKPQAVVYGSAKVWKYTQNIRTVVDNTEFLWILKYSIYSWN